MSVWNLVQGIRPARAAVAGTHSKKKGGGCPCAALRGQNALEPAPLAQGGHFSYDLPSAEYVKPGAIIPGESIINMRLLNPNTPYDPEIGMEKGPMKFRVKSKTHSFDGWGNDRGIISKTRGAVNRVHLNWGQIKKMLIRPLNEPPRIALCVMTHMAGMTKGEGSAWIQVSDLRPKLNSERGKMIRKALVCSAECLRKAEYRWKKWTMLSEDVWEHQIWDIGIDEKKNVNTKAPNEHTMLAGLRRGIVRVFGVKDRSKNFNEKIRSGKNNDTSLDFQRVSGYILNSKIGGEDNPNPNDEENAFANQKEFKRSLNSGLVTHSLTSNGKTVGLAHKCGLIKARKAHVRGGEAPVMVDRFSIEKKDDYVQSSFYACQLKRKKARGALIRALKREMGKERLFSVYKLRQYLDAGYIVGLQPVWTPRYLKRKHRNEERGPGPIEYGRWDYKTKRHHYDRWLPMVYGYFPYVKGVDADNSPIIGRRYGWIAGWMLNPPVPNLATGRITISQPVPKKGGPHDPNDFVSPTDFDELFPDLPKDFKVQDLQDLA